MKNLNKVIQLNKSSSKIDKEDAENILVENKPQYNNY